MKDPLDTFADRPREVHAIGRGLRNGLLLPPHPPDTEDSDEEQPYYGTVYTLARLARAAVLAYVAAAAF